MILVGDCRERLREMADGSVQTCVTSPPYFGLRDYGVAGQIGLEASLDQYVAELVAVFREVRRVLHDTGTLWLNLGDSYSGGGGFWPGAPSNETSRSGQRGRQAATTPYKGRQPAPGYKPKDLLGVPWRVAFALQADGWYLRSDIVWHKPNPMPESVRDRPTKAHEYVFLLTKSPRYFYDAEAVAEPVSPNTHGGAWNEGGHKQGSIGQQKGGRLGNSPESGTRNKRTVWTITPKPFKGAHFAVMPPALVEPCILAGSRPGDLVLDPFAGAGTVGVVALSHGRRFVGVELNPEYAAMAEARIARDVRPRVLALPLTEALEGAAD